MGSHRYAIISDICANLEALIAVLDDIKKQNIQKIFCLGNIVGYGPNPLECIQIIRETANVCLCGHIEYYLLREKEANAKFNSNGRKMLHWNRSLIKANMTNWNWLSGLEHFYREFEFSAVHSDPRGHQYKPIMFKNLRLNNQSHEIFGTFSKTLFVGGNHIPWVFNEDGIGKDTHELNNKYPLENLKTIISSGSVGQPRDGDIRACYIILSNNLITWKRVSYEMEKTVAKIKECDALPNFLGTRLIEGC